MKKGISSLETLLAMACMLAAGAVLLNAIANGGGKIAFSAQAAQERIAASDYCLVADLLALSGGQMAIIPYSGGESPRGVAPKQPVRISCISNLTIAGNARAYAGGGGIA